MSKYLVDVAHIVTDTDLVDSRPQYVKPNKFEETWNHPDPIQRENDSSYSGGLGRYGELVSV